MKKWLVMMPILMMFVAVLMTTVVLSICFGSYDNNDGELEMVLMMMA